MWLLSYKQQSLAYSNMCYLLWSHVEYRIVFFIIIYYCTSFLSLGESLNFSLWYHQNQKKAFPKEILLSTSSGLNWGAVCLDCIQEYDGTHLERRKTTELYFDCL